MIDNKEPVSDKPPAAAGEKQVNYPANLIWSLGLVILGYNLFAYGANFGIGRGLFHLIFTAAVLQSLPSGRRNRTAYLLTGISGISAILVGYRANGFVQWYNMAIAWISLLGLFLLSAIPVVHWKIWYLLDTTLRFFGRTLIQGLIIL